MDIEGRFNTGLICMHGVSLPAALLGGGKAGQMMYFHLILLTLEKHLLKLNTIVFLIPI